MESYDMPTMKVPAIEASKPTSPKIQLRQGELKRILTAAALSFAFVSACCGPFAIILGAPEETMAQSVYYITATPEPTATPTLQPTPTQWYP